MGGNHTKAWNIETSLDQQIPVIPWFVGIYLSFFLFCTVNFLVMGYFEKKKACLFLCAELLAKTVCGIFYLCFPTTNLRPEIVGTDFWSQALVGLYQMDAAVNLFPSIHCMDSWFCVVVIRNIRNVPGWHRVITWIWAVAICASTLFTKQHGILDVAGRNCTCRNLLCVCGALEENGAVPSVDGEKTGMKNKEKNHRKRVFSCF